MANFIFCLKVKIQVNNSLDSYIYKTNFYKQFISNHLAYKCFAHYKTKNKLSTFKDVKNKEIALSLL